ncbi:Chitin deacetylase [Vanrija pseudolonga]|uniref:chitin deacetylase n=1 Tax=Vanrija pseudolonga TaxID=143232 RepID=A0AAF1BKV6_9TREE|nr:Chitin deacetylase [Vanrija pseudolonga]
MVVAIASLFLTLASLAAAQVAPSVAVDPSIPQSAATGPLGFVVPPLSALTSGAPPGPTQAITNTFAFGASPTISGAAPIPTFVAGNAVAQGYPPLDQIPPIDSPQVKAWVASINWAQVPNFTPTDGTCGGSPAAAADPTRCWWTCGGCTRDTDIQSCPDKLTWGLSYDDGPSPYTPLLLNYLNEKNYKSTFFVVGSRVVSRPDMVVAEYMTGHQISIHTWSHASLTKLSNEQIVAELAWTKKAIKDVIGITPNTFRPPYGDIDDRVRAIAAQLGLTPIMWTQYTENGVRTTFDTTDWNIPGGQATGPSAVSKFEAILNTYVPKLNTGFIVLEHDLYQSTVDLAVGYFIPLAEKANKYKFASIIQCLGLPNSEAYIETSANATATLKHSGTAPVFQATVGTGTAAAPTITTGSAATSAAPVSAGNSALPSVSNKGSGASRFSTASVVVALAFVAGAVAFAA